MKNQYRGSQNIISEKKAILSKGFYRGTSHNGFKYEKSNNDQNYKKIYRGQVQWMNKQLISLDEKKEENIYYKSNTKQ